MDYVWFSVWFTLIHLGAYIVAGVVSLQFTRDLYEGDDALFAPFLRDVGDPAEKQRQGVVMWPAQLARGLLMSLVLYPILTPLTELSFLMRFGFLAGLMLVYADMGGQHGALGGGWGCRTWRQQYEVAVTGLGSDPEHEWRASP